MLDRRKQRQGYLFLQQIAVLYGLQIPVRVVGRATYALLWLLWLGCSLCEEYFCDEICGSCDCHKDGQAE
jgi:hypothetical protein